LNQLHELSSPFLENKPYAFQNALRVVFANKIVCKNTALSFAEEIVDLMVEKKNNGGIVLLEDIYELWEDDTFKISPLYDRHHIKPKSRGGKIMISFPKKIHREWHKAFGNLYTKVEIIIFLEKIFKEEVDSFHEINKNIKYAKREAKKLEKAGNF